MSTGAQIYFILRYLKILKNYPESSAVIENAAILQIKKKTNYEHTADRVHNPTNPSNTDVPLKGQHVL
jgi:hypothetical protein